MTSNQAIREAAFFNSYALHLDTMQADLARFGAHAMARLNMDQARDLLDAGERGTAVLYLNRAEWALAQ